MPEYTHDTKKSLDDVLKILNRIIIRADRDRRKKEGNFQRKWDALMVKFFNIRAEKYKKMTDEDADKERAKKFFIVIEGFGKEDTTHKDKSTRGKTIFDLKRVHVEPVRGKGERDKKFYNLDLVIGACTKLEDGTSIEYRVDYGDDKGFHINFDIRFNSDKKNKDFNFPLAFIIKPESKVYDVPAPVIDKDMPAKQKAHKAREIENHKQIMKFKFFIKMTMWHYFLRGGKKDPDKKEEATVSDTFNHVIEYILGKSNNFDSIRNMLMYEVPSNPLPEEDIKILEACQEKDFKDLVVKNKNIRHALIELAINAYSKLLVPAFIADSEGDPPTEDGSEEEARHLTDQMKKTIDASAKGQSADKTKMSKDAKPFDKDAIKLDQGQTTLEELFTAPKASTASATPHGANPYILRPQPKQSGASATTGATLQDAPTPS